MSISSGTSESREQFRTRPDRDRHRFGAFTIEPQAQLIYQYLDMKGSDPMSNIAYDTPDVLYVRVGLRLSSDGLFGMSNVRPYIKANLWQDAVGTDKAIFSATDVVSTSFRTTALEVGGGVVAQLTQHASVWGWCFRQSGPRDHPRQCGAHSVVPCFPVAPTRSGGRAAFV